MENGAAVAHPMLVGQGVELEFPGHPDLAFAAVVIASGGEQIMLSVAGPAPLPSGVGPGTAVVVRFATALGLHRFRTSLVAVSTGRHVTMSVSRTPKTEVIQRRRFFRVPACLSAAVIVMRSEASVEGEADSRALTQDISAGGLRVDTVLPVLVGDRLWVAVETPQGFRRALPPELGCEARVVRVQEAIRQHRPIASLGVEFLFLYESERDRWVQLAFHLQRGAVP
jgi:c-di-GMP-binding flagellar brake protein YcgR